MKQKNLHLTALIFILVTAICHAQTVDEIISKNIEARGGLDKIKAVKSQKIVATGVTSQQGTQMEFPAVIYNKRPDFYRMDVEIYGMNMIRAYDGKMAWQIFPFMGDPDPGEMSGDEAKYVAAEADFDGPLVDYKKKGHVIKLLGKEDMEGTEVYKLEVTLKDGTVRYYYLDAEFYIELKITGTVTEMGQTFNSETFLSDYKEVNGLMIAHSIEVKANGVLSNQVNIDSVLFNVEVDDTFFKMPPKK